MNVARHIAAVCLVFALAGAACSTQNAGRQPQPAPTEQWSPASLPDTVVQVLTLRGGKTYSTGSGTLVGADSRHVLTNAHVVADGDGYEVRLKGVGLAGQLVYVDGARDLAVLRLAVPAGVPARLADAAPDVGSALVVAGYPDIGGDSLTVTRGTVAGFADIGDGLGRVWIKTDATISFGSSGGGAFDERGRLVGIPTKGFGDQLASIGYLLSAQAADSTLQAGIAATGIVAAPTSAPSATDGLPIFTTSPYERCLNTPNPVLDRPWQFSGLSGVRPRETVKVSLRNKYAPRGEFHYVTSKVVTPDRFIYSASGLLSGDTALILLYPRDFAGAPPVKGGTYTFIWEIQGGYIACWGFAVTP